MVSYAHTNKCILQVFKWFLFWQRSSQQALHTTWKPFGSIWFPVASLSQLQLSPQRTLCAPCHRGQPTVPSSLRYQRHWSQQESQSLVSHILSLMLTRINALTEDSFHLRPWGATSISVGPVTISATQHCKFFTIIIIVVSYSLEHGLVSCTGPLVLFCGSLYFCYRPASAFSWWGCPSSCGCLLNVTGLGVHKQGAAETFHCPHGRNLLQLHTVYSMEFVTYFPKGAKSKFTNKHKERGTSEHDQGSTSSLISTPSVAVCRYMGSS